MRSLPSRAKRLRIAAVGWLAGLSVILSAAIQSPLMDLPSEARLAVAPAYEEDSTPDCPVPDTDRERAPPRGRHLAALGVDRWHAAGYRGRGVKIAILDSGFRGYRNFLGSALPDQVTVHSFRYDGNLEAKNSQHGVLCAEVLHELAPEAELLLANWEPDAPERFLDAVRWAREQGAHIISCSVIMPSWSDAEGGGPVHPNLAHVLGSGDQAQDVLFFASAGNIARRHWTGPYRDGAGWHEWQPGITDNRLTSWGRERISVEVCWSTGDGYALQVIDRFDGKTVARSSDLAKPGRRCAVARFIPAPGGSYSIHVGRTQAGGSGAFHLVTLGGELEYSTPWGSVPFPGDGAEVLTVGAVDVAGQRQPYSSCGADPRRPKPDLVAPVPFASS